MLCGGPNEWEVHIGYGGFKSHSQHYLSRESSRSGVEGVGRCMLFQGGEFPIQEDTWYSPGYTIENRIVAGSHGSMSDRDGCF